MQFLRDTHIDFLRLKYIGLTLSAIVVTFCLGYMLINGINLGIDFIGGHLVHLKFQEEPDIESARQKVAEAGFPSAVLQGDPTHNELMIRVQLQNVGQESDGNTTDAEQEQIVQTIFRAMKTEADKAADEAGKLNLNLAGKAQLVDLLLEKDPMDYLESQPTGMTAEAYARRNYMGIAEQVIDEYRESPEASEKRIGIIDDMESMLATIEVPEGGEVILDTIREETFIGSFSRMGTGMVSAAVGSELADAATWAIVFSLAGILAYIWYRFNNRFSLAAICALVHDIIITMGLFTIAGREFNLPIVAAILTIVGYSLNDTIVIFVRIRENLTIKRREAQKDYEGILNLSINSTLSRTLLTSGTTLIVVLFLFFMGGTVINDFAFTLMIGVVVGTYSSVFIASPVLAIWNKITGTTGGISKVRPATS